MVSGGGVVVGGGGDAVGRRLCGGPTRSSKLVNAEEPRVTFAVEGGVLLWRP